MVEYKPYFCCLIMFEKVWSAERKWVKDIYLTTTCFEIQATHHVKLQLKQRRTLQAINQDHLFVLQQTLPEIWNL